MTALSEAALLAAGEGRRMRPLTTYQPKPMLRIGGRPMIEYPLDALAEAGIEHVVLVVGHGSPRIQNHLESSYQGMSLSYVTQRVRLGSGHALQQAAGKLDDEFVVVNGDTVVDATMIEGTIERYRHADASACLAVSTADRPSEYGTVRIVDGEVERVDESGDGSSRVNAGVYAFDRSVFDALDRLTFHRGERPLTEVIDTLDGPVVAATPGGIWFEPSYPWELLASNDAVLANRRAFERSEELVDSTARIHDSAVVEGDVLVGPDCEVSAGAVLRGGTCLHENTRVGENAVIDRSLIGPDSRIGGNVLLRDSIVGSGVEIGDGTVSPGRSASLVVDGREYTDRRLGSIVADRTSVGANATLNPGSRIGPEASVAPGAVVRGNVDAGAEVIV